jgi:hypothetical protein
MNPSASRGLDRRGLDQDFAAQENKKSRLLLEAQLLRDQDQDEAAAALIAEAAQIEEGLSERCLAAGLYEKGWSHRFSAASCWAQAGNFYQAITWCDDLLAQSGLPDSLRHRVETYVQQLRARRARWYAELATATAAAQE